MGNIPYNSTCGVSCGVKYDQKLMFVDERFTFKGEIYTLEPVNQKLLSKDTYQFKSKVA